MSRPRVVLPLLLVTLAGGAYSAQLRTLLPVPGERHASREGGRSREPLARSEEDPELERLESAARRGLPPSQEPLPEPGYTGQVPAPARRGAASIWEFIGPAPILNPELDDTPWSGRVTGLAASPTDPGTLYLSSAGGGAWKTTDGGGHWRPLTDDQACLNTGCIALAPSDPDVIYVGTGEPNHAIDGYYGRGVLKSTDGGETWTLLRGNRGRNEFDRRAIGKIAVDPRNPAVVYVAVTRGGVHGLAGNRGVWKSVDGGRSWINTTQAVDPVGVWCDVVIDPRRPETLYAATGDPFTGARNAIYKTTDGGRTWSVAGDFRRSRGNGRIALALAPSRPETVYAAVVDAATQGLRLILRTTNGGKNWVLLESAPNFVGVQGWYDVAIAVDPLDADRVYGSGAYGKEAVITSGDGGRTWRQLADGRPGGIPHVDHHALAFDARGRLLAGTDGGVWRLDSPRGGRNGWANLTGDLAVTTFNSVSPHPTLPAAAIGGSQDIGLFAPVSGATWRLGMLGDGGTTAVDPDNPAICYGTVALVSWFVRSDDGGATVNVKMDGIDPFGGFSFYPPLAIDPTDPAHLVFGGYSVYETHDRGEHWAAIGRPGDSGYRPQSTIDTMAVAGNSVYAASNRATFKHDIDSFRPVPTLAVTFDGGATWASHRFPRREAEISDIELDPANPRRAWVAFSGFTGRARQRVLATTDGGATLTDITGNLPDLPVHAVKLDRTTGALYVGTDVGVYTSTDGGQTWAAFGSGLPNVRVRELQISAAGYLTAATYGRGAWQVRLWTP